MLLLQDGAGRVGKMLFARQGKKFDYDLKQVNHMEASPFMQYSHYSQFLCPMYTTD